MRAVRGSCALAARVGGTDARVSVTFGRREWYVLVEEQDDEMGKADSRGRHDRQVAGQKGQVGAAERDDGLDGLDDGEAVAGGVVVGRALHGEGFGALSWIVS